MKYKITFSFFVAILLISLYSLFTVAFADDSVQHTNFPTSITSKVGDKSQTLQFNDVEPIFYNTVAGTTCDNAIILSYAITNTANQPGFCYQGYFVKINKSDGVTIKNISACRAGQGLIETDSYYIFSLESLGYSDCIFSGSNVISETDAMYVIDAKGHVNSQYSAIDLALHKLEKISNGILDDDVTCNIQTIDCPSDADVNLYNFLSYNEAKKYKDVKPCIDAEYVFYPSEVAGKTFSVNQTLNFKETVQESFSFSDYISHPVYFANNRRTIYYSYSKNYTFDIPADYQSLPHNFTDYNDSSITYSVYYVPETNKIYVRISVLRSDIEKDFHNYLKDFKNWSDDDSNKKKFKYGYPECIDCEHDTQGFAGKYKHLGDVCHSDKHHTLDSTCQLTTDSASSDYFHFFANLDADDNFKASGDSTYVDSGGTKHHKDGNASIRFLDSEPQGGSNGYIDTHYTDSDKDIIYNTRDDFNLDSDNKVKDPSFSDSVNTLKNLLKSLKDFPQFFADFFDFLPGSYALATLLMILITIMIVIGFVKLVL